MPDPGPGAAYAGPRTSSPEHLAWKLALFVLLLAAVLFGVPEPATLAYLLRGLLIAWGAAFVAICMESLGAGRTGRWLWALLAAGACAALSIPPVATGDLSRMVEAFGPVLVLVMSAQLSRRSLPAAMHDWALTIGLAVFGALGVQALWVVLSSLGPGLFAVAVLAPPVVLELVLLLLRSGSVRPVYRYGLAVVVPALASALVISITHFNTLMPGEWRLFFGLLAGLMVSAALALSLATRRFFDGVRFLPVVEMTHTALLIALLLALPVRFLR